MISAGDCFDTKRLCKNRIKNGSINDKCCETTGEVDETLWKTGWQVSLLARIFNIYVITYKKTV